MAQQVDPVKQLCGKKVVSDFTTSIINLWMRAFGAEFTQPRKVVQEKISKLLQSYCNDITKAGTGKNKKRKADDVRKSTRQLFSD